MSGTFRGTFNTSNDSDRISEELFDAFNMDGYDDDRENRHRSRSGSSRPAPSRSQSYGRSSAARSSRSSGRSQEAARRKKRKDRQLIAMVGLSVLSFLLVVEILLGIFLLDIRALPVFSILIMNLAIGLILGPCFIVAPIIIVVVEIAAGIFAGQWILALMGVLLLVGAQVMCHLLK